MTYGFGNVFLAEVLPIEIELQHAWELEHKEILYYLDRVNVVKTFRQNLDSSRF